MARVKAGKKLTLIPEAFAGEEVVVAKAVIGTSRWLVKRDALAPSAPKLGTAKDVTAWLERNGVTAKSVKDLSDKIESQALAFFNAPEDAPVAKWTGVLVHDPEQTSESEQLSQFVRAYVGDGAAVFFNDGYVQQCGDPDSLRRQSKQAWTNGQVVLCQFGEGAGDKWLDMIAKVSAKAPKPAKVTKPTKVDAIEQPAKVEEPTTATKPSAPVMCPTPKRERKRAPKTPKSNPETVATPQEEPVAAAA